MVPDCKTGIFPNSDTHYVTVTVQRETSKSKEAGDTDVGVADKALQFARELWDEEQNPGRKHFYQSLSDRFWAKVQEMIDREDVYWFDAIGSPREMDYECDSKLEGPKLVDCAKLQYQGLGSGTVEFEKGETKYFNQGRTSQRSARVMLSVVDQTPALLPSPRISK